MNILTLECKFVKYLLSNLFLNFSVKLNTVISEEVLGFDTEFFEKVSDVLYNFSLF